MQTIFLPRAGGQTNPEASVILRPQAARRIAAVPAENWPLWARSVAKFRQGGDLGLGDSLVHLIGDVRSEKFKRWFRRRFGTSCGCTNRQRWLNEKFPYPEKIEPPLRS